MISYRHGFSFDGGARGAPRPPRVRRVASALAVAAVAVTLAACSSSGSSSSSPPASSAPASGGASSSSSGSTGGADITALQSAVDKAAALPSFSDYAANYGGKVP